MLVFQIDQTAKNLSYLEILHLILQIKRKIKLNLKNWKVSYRLHYNFQNRNFHYSENFVPDQNLRNLNITQ